ncbi:MAG TPA: ribosomal protein S18-alanine N-acetyltransferase [Acidimicrobiia bacterium]|nr:ribosomal protein S18-alanine N-acetyltransferase [Acidimicrobiia bacterium]
MAANPDQQGLDITVGPMQRRHLKSVVRIEGEVYPRPWSMSLFLSELALSSSRAYFVAKSGRHVVGYGGVMMSGDDGHITTIAVDPDWQGQAVGTRLLLGLVREAIRRGATSLTLEVRVHNKVAQGLYRTFGFMPVGIRRNYYQETNEDALVMWADHVDTPGYRRRLARIEARVLGTTVFEAISGDW